MHTECVVLYVVEYLNGRCDSHPRLALQSGVCGILATLSFYSSSSISAASVCALITLQCHQNEGKQKINRHFRQRICHYNFVVGIVCVRVCVLRATNSANYMSENHDKKSNIFYSCHFRQKFRWSRGFFPAFQKFYETEVKLTSKCNSCVK